MDVVGNMDYMQNTASQTDLDDNALAKLKKMRHNKAEQQED